MEIRYTKLVQLRKNTPDFYQVVKPIGAGVAGEVYEAIEKATGRRVALKRLFPDISQNVQFSMQFYSTLEKLRTAKQAIELTALAPLLDIYHDNEDALCIVTEFLDGMSLEAYVKVHHILPEYHALDLAARIATGLIQSYSEILPFHGLLNPNNIYLINSTGTAKSRTLKFLDYGTAKAANEYHKARQVASKRKATVALFSVGDPQYLSPEQCRESGDVDAQADVYAIGLLLFYMLSGRPPFYGSEPIKVMSMQMEAEPPSIQSFNKEVSQFSQDLIHEALRKDPSQRPTLARFISRIREYQLSQSGIYNGYRIGEYTGVERYLTLFLAQNQATQKAGIIKLVDPERTKGAFRLVSSKFLASLQTFSEAKLDGFVPTFGFGQLPGQQTYAVFDPPAGTLLADVIAGRQQVESQVWQERTLLICKRLAEILSQAHARKILYLGLRPQNVQIIEDAGAPDGMVIRLFHTETIRPFHQAEHTLRGSDVPENLSIDVACYLSPEQSFGAADTSADVYSLGVILYEMLSGRLPFIAETVQDLKAMHQQKWEPRSLREENNAIAPELASLTHAMLDKAPPRRPTLAKVCQELVMLAESVETQKFSLLALQDFQLFTTRRGPPEAPGRGEPPAVDKPGNKEPPHVPEANGAHVEPESIQAMASKLALEGAQQAEAPQKLKKRPRLPQPPQGEADLPTHFGIYEVVRRLGEGGMGAVYEGVAPESGERVAIKQPRPELMVFPPFAERFHNEVRFARRIKHPGVVQVLHLDRSDDGIPYIVMELIQGETLRSRLDKGRLPLTQLVEIAYQIADTLRAAHQAGVIHRDLKPDNVMLVPDPSDSSRELVKILDFGIAKLVVEYQATLLRTAHKTMPGAVLGTPQYMAPEQRQDSSSVTDRADVYSLGVLLYEMLSGRPPLTVEQAVAMLHTSQYIPPPPLEARASGLPGSLVALVHSMLLEAPAQRPAIGDVSSELKRLARSRDASTLRESSQQIPPLRRKWRLSLAALVVVGLVGSVLSMRLYRGHLIEQRLQSADRAIKERRWSDATVQAKLLLDMDALSQDQKNATLTYLETAAREQQASEKYAQFARTTEPELAHKLYLEIPEHSVYRSSADEKHQLVVKKLTQKYLVLAGTAQAAGLCDDWERRITQAIQLQPDNTLVKAAQHEGCPLPTNTPTASQLASTADKNQADPTRASPATSYTKPPDSPLRTAENAYEQGRYREAIRLVQQTVSGLDASLQVRAWRIMGSAGCQCGDDYSIRDAAELLSSGRAADDFKRMQAVCARKGYQWDGSHFVRPVRSSPSNRSPGNPATGRTP